MHLLTILKVLHLMVATVVVIRIILDTRNTTKALALVVIVIFVPVFGVLAYLLFGVNYRKHKIFAKKTIADTSLLAALPPASQEAMQTDSPPASQPTSRKASLARLIGQENGSPVTRLNHVQLLINGEEKFPELLRALRSAEHHIHLEYYIYEDDAIGNEIAEILKAKAKDGVEVRLIYDDIGSRKIKSQLVPALLSAGVQVSPFYEIKFLWFANRLNYRNHRKIAIVDGHTAFIGGINIGDNYINSSDDNDHVYWRDTHLRIYGHAAHYLQYIFMSDWNHCIGADHQLAPRPCYFAAIQEPLPRTTETQIVASGPDSADQSVLHTVLKSISLARHTIQVTTPYFIPNESLLDALIIAANSGVRVQLMVPTGGANFIVHAASKFYFEALLAAGAEIYLYRRGFVHGKTVVIDQDVSIVGTANMDERSFDLNFEVIAVMYGTELAQELIAAFKRDLSDCDKIEYEQWKKISTLTRLKYSVARLFSPLL